MLKKYNKALFIFRRDLRLHDNTGLIKALQEAAHVIPCFIFDPRQLENNEYRSDNAIQFMHDSLHDLDQQLAKYQKALAIFKGKPEEVIESLIKDNAIDAIYVNHDYTPFSKKRDHALQKVCDKNNIPFYALHDLLLHQPEAVTKKDGKPYTVFTPFFKRATKIPVAMPQDMIYKNFGSADGLGKEYKSNMNITVQASRKLYLVGGSKAGCTLIKDLEDFRNYQKTRDIPSYYTTHLSAYLKFGTVSIREVYHTLIKNFGPAHTLVRQLYWRDFYTMIAWWFPHVFGSAFKEKYDKITWSHDKNYFKHWCEGTTGFPIVDAGMRELNETGFMHNRVRMITGSFLVKDLGIDWRLGEKYFATKLVDYDPAVNNGNWQWVASTGCDPQPYFRIFNPWLQQKKFDPDTLYIKQWIPELEKLTPKEIHMHWKKHIDGYSAPMVDHQKASSMVKSWFKNKV